MQGHQIGRLLVARSRWFLHAAVLALLAVLPASTVTQSLDGFWQADGYGLLVEVRDTKISTFQTTSISCIPWWTARRVTIDERAGESAFNRGDTIIRVRQDTNADVLQMREGPTVSYVTLRRLREQPAPCRETLEDTPLNNYRVFWQTFAEQFALFQVYGVDWAKVDREYRLRAVASGTAEELFNILREMILPFHNAHTNINASAIGRQYLGYRAASPIGKRLLSSTSLSIDEILGMFKQEAERARAIVESRYAVEPLRSYVNDKIHFGLLKGPIGYLRILAFEEYSKDGNFERGEADLEKALDEIFSPRRAMKGLVIDVRINTGGADRLALLVASRLTDVRYLAYSKETRTSVSGPLRFSPPQPTWVDAFAGYLGPVVLLIGPDTLSGGETFAMSLMDRVPRVAFVGENTQGVFSDIWGRKLPNGWTFGVPTERYLTASGSSFDGRGVAPTSRVPVFSASDREAGRDGALERAIRTIDESGRTQR